MEKIEIYFDYVEVGDQVVVGAVAMDDDDVCGSRVEQVRKPADWNNFHCSFFGWIVAVKVAKEVFEEDDVYDRIVFKNQNTILFKWGKSGKAPKKYERAMDRLNREVGELLDFTEVEFSFTKCEGAKNIAKKMLKKRKKKMDTEVEETLGFKPVVQERRSVAGGADVVPMRTWGKKK